MPVCDCSMPTGPGPAQRKPCGQGEVGGSVGARWRVSDDESRHYEIRTAEPLLDADSVDLLSGGHVPGRRFVILDNGVPPWWREQLSTYFRRHGVDIHLMALQGGEACKEMTVVLRIIEEVEAFGLDRRNEPIIVIGGGAVLDVGGFAASIYRRGVPYIRVPTTLVGYVDAAVGIKTAVNFGGLKNLIGTFSAPYLVLLDRAFLRSLPSRAVSSGLGEILKLGLGCDEQIFVLLEREAGILAEGGLGTASALRLLTRSIEVMLRELHPNLHESNLSRAVDLGHTFSQVFEMIGGGGALGHGEAVSLDLGISAILSAHRGLLSESELLRLARLMSQLGLPTTLPEMATEALWRSVLERKRHRGGQQRIPLPRRLGECVFVDDITPDELDAAMAVFLRTFNEQALYGA